MFYHDHAWGITRLNVYAGDAAGYIITDKTEKKLVEQRDHPCPTETIPLVVQDRTFVPQGDKAARTGQLYDQDPTWDQAVGAAMATSGTTTCTCRRRTPATRAA